MLPDRLTAQTADSRSERETVTATATSSTENVIFSSPMEPRSTTKLTPRIEENSRK
jgi:hypothetical protein